VGTGCSALGGHDGIVVCRETFLKGRLCASGQSSDGMTRQKKERYGYHTLPKHESMCVGKRKEGGGGGGGGPPG
jgi:hypothetical protein